MKRLPNRKTTLFLTIISLMFVSSCRGSDNAQPTPPEQNLEPSTNQVSSFVLPGNLPQAEISADAAKQAAPESPAPLPTSYTVVDEFKEPKFKIKKGDVFQDGQLPSRAIAYDEAALLKVLVQTRDYFYNYYLTDLNLRESGVLGMHGVRPEDVFETLNFMIAVLQEDIASGQTTRLKDSAFINQHFRTLEWRPYNPQDTYQETLRITKYAIFSDMGSMLKTDVFNTPLYRLKDEFADTLFYKSYSKQDVLSGIYEAGGPDADKVIPLTYLTRAGLEEALLQGTLSVTFPDGSSTYFNVDKNNGIAYVKGLAAEEQGRYWYFKQTDAIKGYGQDFEIKIPIEPEVTFAGDIANIGLGKIVAIEHATSGTSEINFGVIADTGGAFVPNLFQLDLLAGIYPDRQAYSANTGHLPSYAKAYILVKK